MALNKKKKEKNYSITLLQISKKEVTLRVSWKNYLKADERILFSNLGIAFEIPLCDMLDSLLEITVKKLIEFSFLNAEETGMEWIKSRILRENQFFPGSGADSFVNQFWIRNSERSRGRWSLDTRKRKTERWSFCESEIHRYNNYIEQ